MSTRGSNKKTGFSSQFETHSWPLDSQSLNYMAIYFSPSLTSKISSASKP